MSEKDVLGKFDFDSVTGGGTFIKFQAGKPLTLRILTTDPVVTNKEFENAGEVNISTKFSFVVYNFTDGKAQILSASPSVARKISELHVDPDFGADIRKIDIKISPTGEKMQRKYDVQVLPKTNELTTDQIKECATLKLDEIIKDGSRMSVYDPEEKPTVSVEEPDEVIEDDGQPVNLDDIPF